MKLYRVRHLHEGGTSTGYSWFTSKRAAESDAAAFRARTKDEDGDARVDPPVTLTPTRQGILDFLNRYAGYPDNG